MSQFPDVEISNRNGESHRLWDFRNRSHVAIIVVANNDKQLLDQQFAAAESLKETWNWLGVKFFHAAVSKKPPLEAGIYAIDRFGGLIKHLPFSEDIWKKLEQEFLYYEARHC